MILWGAKKHLIINNFNVVLIHYTCGFFLAIERILFQRIASTRFVYSPLEPLYREKNNKIPFQVIYWIYDLPVTSYE